MTWRRGLVEAFICAAIVALFYHPLWQFGHMLSGGDAANLFWPVKVIAFESIYQDGVIPLWNPWSFMGAPLAASLQHAIFYPPAWIIYGIFPAHIGLNIDNLFHLMLAGIGAWFWLRIAMGRNAIIAVAIGAAFPCIQWFWGHQEHINQIATVAWMPWQAAVAFLYLTNRIPRNSFVLAFSLLGGIQFFAGHPQEAFYSHFFIALMLAAFLIRKAKGNGFAPAMRIAAPFFLSWAIMGLIIAVQLIPTLELSSHSRRQFKDPTYALSYSMPPDVLQLYVKPHAFGSFRDGYWVDLPGGEWDRRAYNEYGLFMGIPLLLLAIIGGVVYFRRRTNLITFLLLIFFLTLLLALGGNTDPGRIWNWDFAELPQPGWSLHELFLRMFPPAEGFRVPARIIIVGNFCFLTLAAFGASAIVLYTKEKKAQVGAMVTIGAAALIALYVPSRKEKYHYLVDADPMVTQLRLDRAAHEIPPTLDIRHFRLAVGDDAMLVAERHLEETFAQGNPLLLRFQRLKPHSNAPAWVPLVDGYEEGLVPTARFKDFLYEFHRNLRQGRPDPTTLKLFGISTIYADPGLPVDTEFYPTKFDESLEERPLYRVPFVFSAAISRDSVEGLDLTRMDGPFWRGGEPHPEFSRVGVSLPEIRLDSNAGLKTEVSSLNSIRISSKDTSAKDVLLAMGWYPGWVHSNSGEVVTFANAIHAELPAASADANGWTIAFQPFSFRLGMFVTAFGLSGWMLLLVYTIRSREHDE